MLNEQEIEALTKIYEHSRVNKFAKGLAEDQVGAPHHVIKSLQEQYLIYSRTHSGKVYWHPSAKGKAFGGLGTRDQIHPVNQGTGCFICKTLGIEFSSKVLEKAIEMKRKVGLLGLTEQELHLVKGHVKE